MIHRKEAEESVTHKGRVDPLPSGLGQGKRVPLQEDEWVGAGVAESLELRDEAAAALLGEQVGVELVEGALALDDGAGFVTFEEVVAGVQAALPNGQGHGARAGGEGRRGVIPDDKMGGEGQGPLLAVVDEDGPRSLHEREEREWARPSRRSRATMSLMLDSACE